MAQWQLSGEYFENCNCAVVCPCLVSTTAPLTARPTEGVCDVVLAFHIDKGNYGGVSLDGLNVALAVHAPGPMADGNLSAPPISTSAPTISRRRRSARFSPAQRAARCRLSHR